MLMTQSLRKFFASESSSGIVLALAAILALIISNSPLSHLYQGFTQINGELRLGTDALVLKKPLIVWVNDLWMAVFFLLVGLEIKREFVAGELASLKQAILPAVAALGGMVVPALIYVGFNWSDAQALRGWAIPAATDIAFAIGILMLLGSRVPASLKIFLTAVAIIDDLGAIVVIALFYTQQLSLPMMAAAGGCLFLLWALNFSGVTRSDVYLAVGLLLWLCVLKSGVHATLAGVATAMFIPMHDKHGGSPLETLEHGLHPWVSYLILPMFAFANAGVSFAGMSPAALLQPLPMGIAMGLLVGKAVGVFGSSWLLIKFGAASRPSGASWTQFFGVCVLCGIGFTMSLFIGGLAFEGLGPEFETQVKLGVLGGSLLAGAIAAWILHKAANQSS
ncbi:Na+/H+ antiporter NhaA [Paucibacter sp. KCTC 42545]|uniref:Na+/H+ antiporter NhaA n=1 Tax=Paucibacter sp. KCTC 42545 TaxID=1768242 RepID=UPI000733BDA4|nr:Na+/H+ antiporter NhaA [Paucibacter sp. KCTC 42545]ALT76718.1 sodium:proton antiporter [Paucibacter sp. KCTC 42545]